MRKRKKKAFWKSKTFWTALLSLVVQILGQGFGIPVPEDFVATILPVLMMLLRAVSKEPIGLKDEYEEPQERPKGERSNEEDEEEF